MAELADALDLGSSAKSVQVRPLLPAPQSSTRRRFAPSGAVFVFTLRHAAGKACTKFVVGYGEKLKF